MDEPLSLRLLGIEDALLSTVEGDPTSLDGFVRRWRSIQHDIKIASQLGTLDNETLALSAAVSSRVGIITETFIALHSVSKELTTTLKTELEDIFAKDDTVIANSRGCTLVVH